MDKKQPDYDYRDTFEADQGIAVVGKNGKFGYINRRGKEITPIKYDRAMRFYWDVGKVQLDGKWGLVNKLGMEITPPLYDEIKGHQDPIVRLGDKYGFVSRKTGKLLTPVMYDAVMTWTQILNFSSIKYGKKDLAPVQSCGKWGCINVQGKEVIPVKYDEIHINQFDNPRITAKIDGKWGFVDENGKEITDFEYDEIEEFSCDLALVKKDGKHGFINPEGAIVIPLAYDDCDRRFSWEYLNDERQILPIRVKRDGKYGFIDTKGNEIIKPKYESVKRFSFISNGQEGQLLAATALNGKAGFIDETEKTIIPFMYEPDFENRQTYNFQGVFANVRQGGKWGVIDVNNQIVIPFWYDEFLENRDAGFRYAMRDGKKWSIDTKGNEWEMKKNPDKPTFKDYLHAVKWTEVVESFSSFILNEEDIEKELKIYKSNFLNFKGKQFKPSNDIIRIHSRNNDDENDGDKMSVGVTMYSVKDECSYVFFDWEEILDMEVRIEDNLTLSKADIVAFCIYDASDESPITEAGIKRFFNRLDEQVKTLHEN